MSAKETWINKTMESIEDIRALEVPSGMANAVINRLSIKDVKILVLRPQFALAVAAGIAFLICMNAITLVQYNKSNNYDKIAAKAISTEYFSYTEQF